MNVNVAQQTLVPARALEGRVAIVTGSTSGIGLGIARGLAAAGASVVLNGFGEPRRSKSLLDNIASSFGVRATFSDADMSRPGDREPGRRDARASSKRVDILVNNAGIQHVAPLESFRRRSGTPSSRSTFPRLSTRRAPTLPGMRAQEMGPDHQHRLGARAYRLAVQVGLCRGQARHRRPDQGDGARNRRGRHHLQRHLPRLRLDAAGRGADRGPGEGARHLARGGDPRRAPENQPNKRFATVEEMAALAVFLASDAAASITGAALPVDGGWTAH